ncbi:FliG C-terminal domain-containing protein [Psychromarinibacter sp. C21-152]|uniref:Flagellar motor switch protein FliG n=1 Tax=Psychromarinibacter sediminicola TaxID=3033385 RepID=A0AAE3NWR4_9RHOB|nr:FliG C-terminal domain-containing protein [Psychromarinibacter sediminicola]MDF0602042.1 FliG C-terminal domain-containing protein [Psychromarinibacter sediminicola]
MPTEMTLAGAGGHAARLSKRQKAAIVVRLLRSEGIDLSLADLPESLQIGLTREMGNLRFVSRKTLKAVVDEFVEELDALGLSFPSGLGDALSLLDGTISPAAAERLRLQAGIGAVTDPWGRLSQLDAARLRPLIEEESTEIGAVALSKLKVSKAAEILGLLPGTTARRLAYAMGQTSAVSPATVDRIGAALVAQIDAETPRAFAGGPVERVGAILNSSPAATRDEVLDGLDEADKAFADEVRKAIFTFSNIPQRLDPRDVPRIAREIDGAVLIKALAAALQSEREAASAEFVLSNMSQRLAQQMRDEMETLGKVKGKEGEDAMAAVVAAIRAMEAAGEIMLVAEDE